MLDNRGWFIDNNNSTNNVSNFATSVPKNIAFRPTSAYSIPQRVIDIYIFSMRFVFFLSLE